MSHPYGNPYGHPGGGYPPMMPQQGYPQGSVPYNAQLQPHQPTPNPGKWQKYNLKNDYSLKLQVEYVYQI